MYPSSQSAQLGAWWNPADWFRASEPADPPGAAALLVQGAELAKQIAAARTRGDTAVETAARTQLKKVTTTVKQIGAADIKKAQTPPPWLAWAEDVKRYALYAGLGIGALLVYRMVRK